MGEVSPLYDHDRMIIWGLEITNVTKLVFPPLRCFARPSPAARLHLPWCLECSGDAATTVGESPPCLQKQAGHIYASQNSPHSFDQQSDLGPL